MSLNKAGFNAAANIHPETEKTISVNGDADYQAAETVGPVADKAAKRVLIIAYYFPPLSGSGVQRTLKLVKYLRAYNWEPVVLTTGDDYALEDPSLLKELPEGIEVIRINTPAVIGHDLRVMYLKWIRNLLDEGLFKFYRKLLNRSREGTELYNLPDAQALWACRAIDETGKKIDRTPFDLIYTTSGPYSDHMIGFYLKRLTGKPWVADFRDEWSYNPSAALEKGSQAFRLNYSIEKTVVETADRVVAVTPLSAENYARNFKLRPEKVACITNGYDEEDFEGLCLEAKNDRFTLLHNGLLYLDRHPGTLLLAIRQLIDEGRVEENRICLQLCLTECDAKLRIEAENLGLGGVVVLFGHLPHRQSLELAAKADALLVILGTGAGNEAVYPGKIFEYLRLGKPVLSLGPRESICGSLVKSLGRGIHADAGDLAAVKAGVLTLYTRWGSGTLPRFSPGCETEQFERRQTARQFAEIFDGLTPP